MAEIKLSEESKSGSKGACYNWQAFSLLISRNALVSALLIDKGITPSFLSQCNSLLVRETIPPAANR